MPDIYFNPKYGEVHEGIEKGKNVYYKHQSIYGEILHMFIKREIPYQVNNEIFYDLVTPYGYGGPIIIKCIDNQKQNLLNGFHDEFKIYCQENNIISEFVRFHPIQNNGADFENIYDVSYIRNTLGTKIKDLEDPTFSEFSKSARKSIRAALNAGVDYRVERSPKNIDRFKEIYYSTMNRNDASEFYYFDGNYFKNCLNEFSDNTLLIEVLYENKVIAAGFYFVYGKVIHAHLSGTLKEYMNLSASYIIKYATVKWAKENQIDLVHYGGGTSNEEEDPLYKFKKKFSGNTQFQFSIGKKVWNKKIYDKLVEVSGKSAMKEYFPIYRA